MNVTAGMNHITLGVTDIYQSFRFYEEIVGLRPLCRWDRGAYFLAGDFWFCLNVEEDHVPTSGYTHYAFTVPEDMFLSTKQRVIDAGATVFKENTSPGDSLYFLDPDEHKLEIHVGDWRSRIAAKKENSGSWKEVKWFV